MSLNVKLLINIMYFFVKMLVNFWNFVYKLLIIFRGVFMEKKKSFWTEFKNFISKGLPYHLRSYQKWVRRSKNLLIKRKSKRWRGNF